MSVAMPAIVLFAVIGFVAIAAFVTITTFVPIALFTVVALLAVIAFFTVVALVAPVALVPIARFMAVILVFLVAMGLPAWAFVDKQAEGIRTDQNGRLAAIMIRLCNDGRGNDHK